MKWCLISWTEHLNTSGITSHGKDSFHVKPITLAILFVRSQPTWLFSEGVPEKQEFVKTIRQERTSSEDKSDGFHLKCSIELWTILMFKLLLCSVCACMCVCVCVCVCVCLCVYVCVCLYSSTCWFLLAAQHLWHTWEVRINDLLLWVLWELLPSSFISISESILFHLQRRKLQPSAYWRENDMI